MDKSKIIRGGHLSEMMDRRVFVQRTAVLGLGVAGLPLIVPGRVLAAKTGGHLKIASLHGSTTDSVDPGTYENGFTIMMSYTMHSKLTVIASDNTLQSDLAESWEGAQGATKWVFQLRDAEFHNGKPVTAADVVASLNHHRGDTKSAAKPILESVKELKADGKKTIIVELDSGNADFPFILTDYHLSICMANPEGKVDWNDAGSRSGPYRMTAYQPGVRASYEKADNHWNSNIGHVASAEVITISDVTARQNALNTGEVDVADRPDLNALEMLKERPDITVEESTGYRFHSFNMLCDTPPFDNNDVRLAFKYAMDREALLKVALLGHGIIGNDHPITPSYRYYAKDIPQREYDLDKAKFHLKKAGYSKLDVDLSASEAAYAAAVNCSVLYKAKAEPAGLNINVVREPADGYWSNVWLKKAFSACDWGGRPTEDQMFSVAFKAGAPWNDTHFNNERFEKLLLEARSELDDAKRRDMYGEMQRIVNEEGGVIVPMLPNNIWAKNNRVQHDEKISSAWEMDGLQAISRWWIEA